MLHNRSYTTGHKSYRARATIELGEALGWQKAHSVLYAGVPDLAVGPRWYSTYEMGCNVVQNLLDGRDQALLRRTARSAPRKRRCWSRRSSPAEPSVIEALVALLKAGRGPRRILDAIQVAAAQVILETGHPNNFSMSQHGYEYCNTLGWFFDTFEHPHRLKLLFVAASFINRASSIRPTRRTTAAGPSRRRRARRRCPRRSCSNGWRRRCWPAPRRSGGSDGGLSEAGFDRAPLVEALATAACILGNDPHNQELGLCLLEDYRRTKAAGRDRLLLACAKHTAGHRKYGDPLEAYRRFAEAFDLLAADGAGRAHANSRELPRGTATRRQ